MTLSISEWLENYIPEPNSGCWLWLGARDPAGYGILSHRFDGSYRRSFLKAHRESYRFHCGDPGKLSVLHHCDTRCCINPEHLYAGTQQQNVNDMMRRGRQVKVYTIGETHGMAKLTALQVIEIRKRASKGELQAKLAKEFGVTQPTISRIKNRERW